jgi:hypothetical protein
MKETELSSNAFVPEIGQPATTASGSMPQGFIAWR